MQTTSAYATVKGQIDQRKVVAPPVTLAIASSCPSLSGEAAITIKNTSQQAFTGTLQVLVKERGVKFTWGTMTYVECIVRDMLPDDKGEEITLNAGQSITKTRTFTLQNTWKKDSCRVVAFVQKSNKEIVEGCISGLNEGTPIVNTPVTSAGTVKLITTPESIKMYLPEQGKSLISVLDILGKEIAAYTLNGDETWFSLPDVLTSGVYIIHIKTANKDYQTKIRLVR